jgi:dienelactone hydrolase
LKSFLKKSGQWIKAKLNLIAPGQHALSGSAKGIWVLTVLLFVYNAIVMAANTKDPFLLLLVLAFFLLAFFSGGLLISLISLIYKIPPDLKRGLFICMPLLFLTFMNEPGLVLFILVLGSVFGAAYWVSRKTGFRKLTIPRKVVFVIGVTIGLAGICTAAFYYFKRGLPMDVVENAAKINASQIPHIRGGSPASEGGFAVKTLTYGSGTDKRRTDFGNNVAIKTSSVDGTAFLDNWKKWGGKLRTLYWGFDDKSLPINARVWYPDGEGPFPLVLVVHGNHFMTDYSDPGYDYLGELLASRGFIMASVDQNFINGHWINLFGGLENENDARGWLLLEHVKAWHQWNTDTTNPFFGKVDTGRIALIGHSRGGEAVAHAAMFNSLDNYPDDASVPLNYHFKIKSIIAIAPSDGQYQSGETLTRVKDINYFVLHGAQDGDVTTFMGSMQFERIDFTGKDYYFKSGLYIHGANHGQFNSSWGDNDNNTSFPGLFNKHDMMPEREQQQIAKVYISAFLETTLLEKKEFLPLFTDARHGRNWLPETIYLNQFEDANTRYLATYGEDFDVGSGTMETVALQGKNLSVWREQEIKLKNGKKGSRGVYLGWHYNMEKADTSKGEKPSDCYPESVLASYSIQFKPDILSLDTSMALVFSMAESKEDSNPKASGKWVVKQDKDKVKDKVKVKDEVKEKKRDKKETSKPIDFTIKCTDAKGLTVQFPLSNFSALQRALEVRIWKLDYLKGNKGHDNVFQKFIFPLSALQTLNPDFSVKDMVEVRFFFDQLQNGVVVLDNVGFMKRF